MMINYIPYFAENQDYITQSQKINEEKQLIETDIVSIRNTRDVICPECGGRVHVYDSYVRRVFDYPMFPHYKNYLNVRIHRYRCQRCTHTFSEQPSFIEEETRVTILAAAWIKAYLAENMSVKSVSSITGVNWNTVRRIQQKYMEEIVGGVDRYKKFKGYRPKYLAVDEFAIHKGHTYATCVMDLEDGEILWVGKGRAKKDFEKFFEFVKETEPELLSEVKAFAMDMNASYNKLVEEHLPHADIVYDRFHIQSQFGKDVLGSVRLESARRHQKEANELKEKYEEETDPLKKLEMRKEEKAKRHEYAVVKKSRWPILMGQEKLTEKTRTLIDELLDEHLDLSVCYAMKEEMREIFSLDDEEYARIRWEEWFKRALESGIPQLVKFAEKKKVRIEGLINHAKHQINTARLEGFNNRIKVAKRIAYGYRDDEYFFTLIRYISISEEHSRLFEKWYV